MSARSLVWSFVFYKEVYVWLYEIISEIIYNLKKEKEDQIMLR
jgi:hypothetical protein